MSCNRAGQNEGSSAYLHMSYGRKVRLGGPSGGMSTGPIKKDTRTLVHSSTGILFW